MISEAAAARQAAYDNAVAALHRVNPKVVPIAAACEPLAIARVAEQARQTKPPKERAQSPEWALRARVSNMQGAVATLVAEAKRKNIPAELPPAEPSDPGQRLQMLNDRYDQLEKRIKYFAETTQEQRAIDEIGTRLQRVEKRVDAIATAMAALGELLPLLMQVKDNAR